jgi:hypothetical protein
MYKHGLCLSGEHGGEVCVNAQKKFHDERAPKTISVSYRSKPHASDANGTKKCGF